MIFFCLARIIFRMNISHIINIETNLSTKAKLVKRRKTNKKFASFFARSYIPFISLLFFKFSVTSI